MVAFQYRVAGDLGGEVSRATYMGSDEHPYTRVSGTVYIAQSYLFLVRGRILGGSGKGEKEGEVRNYSLFTREAKRGIAMYSKKICRIASLLKINPPTITNTVYKYIAKELGPISTQNTSEIGSSRKASGHRARNRAASWEPGEATCRR
jgi:hypothetical protein